MAGKKTTSQRKVPRINFGGRMLQRALIGLACLIFVVSGGVWLYHIHNDPRRVFEGMVVNNLRTTGVVDHIEQTNQGQKLDQVVQFVTGPLYTAQSQTTITQGLDNPDIVKTESIGTPYLDFVRYLDIQTAQKGLNGKPLDFSKVMNIWGKDSTGQDNQQTTGQLYSQSVLGVVPYANLSAADRKQVVELIKEQNIYQVDYKGVKKTKENGRPSYVYMVTIRPEAYVGMLKRVAHSMNLTQLEGVDPSAYAHSDPISFTFHVDVWSRQLTQVEYEGGTRKETLSSFGLQRPVTNLPTQTIPVDELQTRLQTIQ
jgi:hypothetical protein